MKPEHDKKIYKALIDLEKNCPELFYIMRAVKVEVLPPAKCPTAFCGKTKSGFRLGINETWVETFDVFNLSAIFEHELLHAVLDHCAALIDSVYRNKQIANIAMDAIINDIGHYFQDRKKLNQELNNGVYLDKLNAAYKSNFDSQNNTSLEIYNFLMNQKDNEKVKSFDAGLSDESGGEQGEDDQESDGQASEALDKAVEKLVKGKVKDGKPEEKDGGEDEQGQGSDKSIGLDDILSPDEMTEIFKTYGKKSSDIKKLMVEIEKREKNKKIKRAIENFFVSNKAEVKKSIKKINKRFSFLPYGRQRDQKQKVLLALDVSGSMLNPDDLAKLKMSVMSAVNNGFAVDLIFGDTRKLGEFKDIKPSFDFSQIFGGGGTDLKFIFKDVKFSSYDCFVIVTDGEFDWRDIPTKLKNSILFLNTTARPVDGFKNLHI